MRCWLLLLLTLAAPVGCQGRAPTPPPEPVVLNDAGWPIADYVAFFGALGAGKNPDSHCVAYKVARDGWTQYVDEQVQPLLDGPNPPARLVVHAVGPAWPKVHNGEPRFRKSGHPMRWFEYDWPLTVAEGREREDGLGRWPGMPAYVDDFVSAWRSVADGERSGGVPVETYVYTGMLQTPWLEKLRKEDPDAYHARLIEVARYFQLAGFSGMYVDASASDKLPAGHLGLKTLVEIDVWPDFFVGVESYPHSMHDGTTPNLRYFFTHNAIKTMHPRFPDGPPYSWQSRLARRGLVVWMNNWGGGPYALTPERAQQTVAAGADIGVSWARWNDIAPEIPPQHEAAEPDEQESPDEQPAPQA